MLDGEEGMKRRWLTWIVGITLFCIPAFAGYEEKLQAGSLALKKLNQKQAIEHFSQIIDAADATQAQRVAAFSGRCAAHYKQSLISKETRQARQAIDDCSWAIAIQSDYQRAYRLRGTAYLTIGDLDHALSDLNVAVALDPKDYLSLQNRGLVRTNQNHIDTASADFDAAIKINPRHPWNYYSRGQLYASQDHHEQAIADFNRFIRLRQNYGPAYLHRGKSWMLTEQYPQAVADFDKAFHLQPAHKAIQAYRGITLFLLGEYAKAENDLRTAIQNAPQEMENRVWLFLALEWQKKPSNEAFSIETEQLNRVDPWPSLMSDLLLNKISTNDALDSLQKVADLELRRKQESLILFLSGEQALLRNLPDEAKHWFQKISIGQKQMPTIRHATHHALRKLSKQAEPKPMQAQSAVTIATPKPDPMAKPAAKLTTKPSNKPETKPIQESTPEVTAKTTDETTPEVTTENTPEAIRALIREENREANRKKTHVSTPEVTTENTREAIREANRKKTHVSTPKKVTTESAREAIAARETRKETREETREAIAARAAREAIREAIREATREKNLKKTPEEIAARAAREAIRAARGTNHTLPHEPANNLASIPRDKPIVASIPRDKPIVEPTPDSNFGLTREAISEIDFLGAKKKKEKGKPHAKGKFAFRVGSFRNTENADRALANVSRKRFPVYIQKVMVNNQPHIRVWAGPFKSNTEATKAHQRMEEMPNSEPGPVMKF